jgi:hypothetical protein
MRTTTTPTLTALEQKVYEALLQNAQDCSGGDFACAEEVDTKSLRLTKQQFGALLTTLQEKRVISVDITYINGSYRSKGTKVTQVTIHNQ